MGKFSARNWEKTYERMYHNIISKESNCGGLGKENRWSGSGCRNKKEEIEKGCKENSQEGKKLSQRFG